MNGRRRAAIVSRPGEPGHRKPFVCALCDRSHNGSVFVALVGRKICLSCARAIYVRLNREVELGGSLAHRLDKVGRRRGWPEKRRELLAKALPEEPTVEQYGLLRGVLAALRAQARWRALRLGEEAPEAEEKTNL